MAYFNYYFYKKLIRTFINFLFSFLKKHKKIVIFLLLFIAYLFISNKCFAFNVEYNDIVYDVPDFPFDTEEHPEWVFGKKSGNQFAVGYMNNTGNNKAYTTNPGVTRISYHTFINTSGTLGQWTWFYTNFNSDTWSASAVTTTGALDFSSSGKIIISSVDIYSSVSSTDIAFLKNSEDYFIPDSVQASFISTRQELETSGNDMIIINPGSFSDVIELRLYNIDTNTLLFSTPLKNYDDYVEREDLDNPFSNLVYKIPYSALPSFTLQNGVTYDFRLVYTNEEGILTNISLFFTANGNTTGGGGTGGEGGEGGDTGDNITNSDINNSIKDTNDKLDNIEDTITDSNVDVDVENDLPSVNVEDPTQQGIDNIFNSIYNAFCTGEAQNIVLPIPYTEKTISISPYYVRDMLNNNGVGWLYIFIQAFWAYLFGKFIIKDISDKINKIKSGDIDNIQNTNIKEEML